MKCVVPSGSIGKRGACGSKRVTKKMHNVLMRGMYVPVILLLNGKGVTAGNFGC